MRVNRSGEILNLSEIRELSALTSSAIRTQVQDSLAWPVREICVDLGETKYMDCRGLGALLSIRKEISRVNPAITFHLQNPSSEVARLVSLTGLDSSIVGETRGVRSISTVSPSIQPALTDLPTTATAAVPILLQTAAASEVVTKTE